METTILLALQSMRVDGLTQLLALVSALGNQAFIWLLIGFVCLFISEKREEGVCIFLAVAVVFIVSEVGIEHLVARVRPCDAGIGVSAVMGVSHNGYSFPSGHTTSSFACATVIAAMSRSRKGAVAAVCFALLIAFSRLYLGVHYPTDVLGGIGIGAVCGALVVWVWRAFLGGALIGLFSKIGAGRGQAEDGAHARKAAPTTRHLDAPASAGKGAGRARGTARTRGARERPARTGAHTRSTPGRRE